MQTNLNLHIEKFLNIYIVMEEIVPFDEEKREIMIQGMTDEEYKNAYGPIEDAFDVQGDCACAYCGSILKASLVNNGVEEQVK